MEASTLHASQLKLSRDSGLWVCAFFVFFLPCSAPLSRKLCRLNRVFLEARYWINRCRQTETNTRRITFSHEGRLGTCDTRCGTTTEEGGAATSHGPAVASGYIQSDNSPQMDSRAKSRTSSQTDVFALKARPRRPHEASAAVKCGRLRKMSPFLEFGPEKKKKLQIFPPVVKNPNGSICQLCDCCLTHSDNLRSLAAN